MKLNDGNLHNGNSSNKKCIQSSERSIQGSFFLNEDSYQKLHITEKIIIRNLSYLQQKASVPIQQSIFPSHFQ